MRTLVIGLGQEAAGDDGVGLAVLGRLREIGVPGGVELVEAREESDLIPLLGEGAPVILVDAVVGGRAGELMDLTLEDLAGRGAGTVSTHGIGLEQAVGLARELSERFAPSIRIVGVAVERPHGLSCGLSPEVAAAVPRAAERVLALLGA